MESKIRLNILGIGRSSKSRKLDEKKAIELASEMLGEIIVFSVAAATLFAEYRRQGNKEALKEEQLNDRLTNLDDKMDSLKADLDNLIQQNKNRKPMDTKQLEAVKASLARLEISEHLRLEGLAAKTSADTGVTFTLTRAKDM